MSYFLNMKKLLLINGGFRIGDALIENLLNCTVVSDDVMERTFKSIWPVPSTYECQKMYRLYTESQIYYK